MNELKSSAHNQTLGNASIVLYWKSVIKQKKPSICFVQLSLVCGIVRRFRSFSKSSVYRALCFKTSVRRMNIFATRSESFVRRMNIVTNIQTPHECISCAAPISPNSVRCTNISSFHALHEYWKIIVTRSQYIRCVLLRIYSYATRNIRNALAKF